METNKDNFEELKAEILRRAKEANACTEEYGRAYKATSLPELMTVVKDNFSWCVRQHVITGELIDSYEAEFNANDIRHNCDACSGFLLCDGSAMVTAYDSAVVAACDSATVRAYNSATVEACDSATVEAYDSAAVAACDSVTVKAYNSATVEAYDRVTVKAYNSATVEAYGRVTVKAYNSVTVKAYNSVTVEVFQLEKCELHEQAMCHIRGGKKVVYVDPEMESIRAEEYPPLNQ